MPPAPAPNPRRAFRRLPLAALAVLALVGLAFLQPHLNVAALARHRDALLAWRDSHYLLSAAAFVLAYGLVVVASLPGALAMTLAGGFLFGLWGGAFFNLVGAWTGAMAVFLAVRAGLGQDLAHRLAQGGGGLARLQAAIVANAWPALFALRLLPVVPFFLANLLPAALGVRIWVFAVTTFFGILPAGVIYTALGAGMGEVLERGEEPDLGIIFEPQLLLPLLGLAALAFLPLALRLWRRGRGG